MPEAELLYFTTEPSLKLYYEVLERRAQTVEDLPTGLPKLNKILKDSEMQAPRLPTCEQRPRVARRPSQQVPAHLINLSEA